MDVKEHGAGGVGDVGGVDGPASELPQQPGVHRAEQNLPPAGLFPGPLHMVEHPLDLGGGEVRVGNQASGGTDMLLQAVGPQPVHQLRRAAALPDDGVVDGPPGGPVPQNGGLTLVGDADGGDLRRVYPRLGDDLHHYPVLGGPDLHGVMLHPPLPGVELGELLLRHAENVLLPVKEDGAGTGGALIQREKIGAHSEASF